MAQFQQIHDVDETDLQCRELLVQNRDCRKCLQVRFRSRCCDHDIRFFVSASRSPVDHFQAIFDQYFRFFRRVELRTRVFRRYDQVDLFFGSHRFRHHGHQGVRIRRQVFADEFRFLLSQVRQQTWILVGVTIVVLLENGRSRDQVQ